MNQLKNNKQQLVQAIDVAKKEYKTAAHMVEFHEIQKLKLHDYHQQQENIWDNVANTLKTKMQNLQQELFDLNSEKSPTLRQLAEKLENWHPRI